MRDQRETIAERSRTKGMKDWDRAVSGLWGLCYFIAIPLVAGLNARLGWTSQLAIARHTAGIVLFAAGFALTVWSMVENIYFSTILRVQEERGHTVCTRGPYHFVRHPAYVGAILQSLAIPLVFGSVWTLTLGAAAATLMMVRTVLEDCTLRDELAGYEEYTTITPYRLVPGIW